MATGKLVDLTAGISDAGADADATAGDAAAKAPAAKPLKK